MTPILVIDDNPSILFVMKEALEMHKYTVIPWETFEGIKEVERINPAVIFLDVFLTNGGGSINDGRQGSLALKANKKTRHIPIVIISAYPNLGDMMREAKADDYLAKPFNIKDLVDKAKRYVKLT